MPFRPLFLFFLICVCPSLYSASIRGLILTAGGMATYAPEPSLHSALLTSGYSGLSDLDLGFTYGAGFFTGGFYIGGYGLQGIGGSGAVSGGNTLTVSSYSGGAVEAGYALFASQSLIVMPAALLSWMGRQYTFTTNMTIEQFSANPVAPSPYFRSDRFSAGLSLYFYWLWNSLSSVLGIPGVYTRISWSYILSGGYGPFTVNNAPAPGTHMVSLSLGFLYSRVSSTRTNAVTNIITNIVEPGSDTNDNSWYIE